MRRFLAIIFIILTSFPSALNSQTSHDLTFAKKIYEQIYLTNFEAADSIIIAYENVDAFALGPKLFRIMLTQGRIQDLESINMSESEALFSITTKFIETVESQDENDVAWKHYMLGMAKFVMSAEKKRVGENLEAIQLGYDALDHMENAVELNPKLNDGHIAIGVFKYWKSVYTKWIPFFTNEIEDAYIHFENAKSGDLFLNHALSYQLIFIKMYEENHDEAIRLVEQGLKSVPQSRLFKWAGAFVFRKTGDFEKAYALYSELYDYYINTSSIINQLECLQKRIICLKNMGKRGELHSLFAELDAIDVKKYSHDKVIEKVREINELGEDE